MSSSEDAEAVPAATASTEVASTGTPPTETETSELPVMKQEEEKEATQTEAGEEVNTAEPKEEENDASAQKTNDDEAAPTGEEKGSSDHDHELKEEPAPAPANTDTKEEEDSSPSDSKSESAAPEIEEKIAETKVETNNNEEEEQSGEEEAEDGELDDASKLDVDVDVDEQSVGNNEGGEEEKIEDAMDTEEQEQDADAGQTEQADESAASKELPYSTRGRSTGTGNDTGSGGENWERDARETLEEIGRAKEHTSAASLGASFLESLTEEERRTRTRFLPDVDGMHVLRKNEVKEDLALARSLVSAAGVTSIKKSKGKRSRTEEDTMDVDEEEGVSPSEDDRSSDIARLGTSTIELRSRDLVVPSNAFVAPIGASVTSSSNEDPTEGRESQSVSLLKAKNGVQSPWAVDSVTAFNPPRPPESIGAKKKHRMLRWERRPEDVEVDLNNYRKTVQRTRQELHNAEAEYERLETIDAHLRWHFMGHLNLMNEEYLRLNEELGSVQQECVKGADLLTSRTRSRGAGKGSYAMRDVLTVLKTRGAESREKDFSETESSPADLEPVANPGVGGLPPLAFCDWNHETNIAPRKPASSWIVPGEKVKTPYGEGIVVDVHPAVTSNGDFSAKPSSSTQKDGKDADSDKQNGDKASTSGGEKAADPQKYPKRKKADQKKGGEKANPSKKTPTAAASILPPRVAVRLPYGTGHFVVTAVTPTENPSLLSDAKLVKRWKGMVETALSVGGCLDLEGMTAIAERAPNENDDSDEIGNEHNSQMDVDEPSGDPEASQTEATGRSKGAKSADGRFLPFGAGLLPTSSGRGSLLHKLSITDIEEGLQEALFAGGGVLGRSTNPGVPTDLRNWEENEQEYLTLQASVLQLRNSLVRQKRMRLLNERTSVATSDRYHRGEELVSEMRADLKSLKHRLEEELTELGINEEAAEQILSSFYYGQEAPGDNGEASPLKRTRRSLSRDEDEGMVDDNVNVVQYGDEADRDSTDEHGTEDLSGDDLEAHRLSNNLRPNQ